MKKSSASEYKSGGGLKILLYIFVFPILLFIVALLLLLLPLPASFPPPGSSARNLPVAILTGVSGMAFLIWIAKYSQSKIRKASHSMDSLFLQHGFHLGKAYGFARTFQGNHDDLCIQGDLFPDYKLQPWRFNISAVIFPGFHAVLSNRKPLMTAPNMAPHPPESQLSHLFIYSDHPDAINILLDQCKTVQLIQNIHESISSSDTWQILIEPKKLQLRVMSYSLCTEYTENWMKYFFQLAKTFNNK